MSSYRGRPSKGCESCRTRKVKCDETKPICTRCTRSGHECKYRDQADLLFRNQTAFAAQKAEGSWRKRSKPSQRKDSDSTAATVTSPPKSQQPIPGSNKTHTTALSQHPTPEPTVPVQNFNELSLVPAIQPDLRRLAYERFIYDFVVFESPERPPDEVSDALWDFIPPLYEQAQKGSCLATVIEAASYANFANRCHAPQALKLADESISKGIKLLQATLADKEMALSDDALCAVFMMGVYENLTLSRRDGTYAAHSNGANALLQMRTFDQFCTSVISFRLYELIFWQQLISNLQNGRLSPIPVKNIILARQHFPNFYSASGIHVIQLIHNLARMHSKWHETKHSPSQPTSRLDLQELFQTALDLDAQFQAWESTIRHAWRYQMERNTLDARSTYDVKWRNLFLGSRGAPEEIHSYTTLKKCWIWMFYRTSRIILLRDQLEIINWMFKLQPPTQESIYQYQDSFSASNETAPLVPDNVGLQIHHSFATTHLVNVMEKSSSAVLGTFTVNIYGKSEQDVVGIRGYTMFWSLGVMDAVLKSGLIPDSGAPASPPNSGSVSPYQAHARLSSIGSTPFTQLHNMPAASPAMFNMPAQSMHPMYHQGTLNGSQMNEFPNLPPTQQTQVPQSSSHSSSQYSPMSTNLTPQAPSTPLSANKGHIFDSSPHHPLDSPTALPTLDFSITKPARIDVAARREWLNRVLYYLGTELGIKKAYVVPATEGYLETCKTQVEALLAQ